MWIFRKNLLSRRSTLPDDFPAGGWESERPLPGDRLQKGHLKQALINDAVDEAIARSIFRCIFSSKGPRSYPLEDLTIMPTSMSLDGRSSLERELSLVNEVISEQCHVRRGIRDDERDDLFVETGDSTMYLRSARYYLA